MSSFGPSWASRRRTYLGDKPRFSRPLTFKLGSADILHFLHIPKTAGTTFYAILEERFPGYYAFPRERGESLISVLEDIAPGEEFPFRITRAHNDYSIFKSFPRFPVVITMLREPIARVISLYSHIRRVASHPDHSRIVEENVDIESFCANPDFHHHIRNLQVRSIAGEMGDAELEDEELLELAKIHLDDFAFFGLVERFAESVHLLFHTFGWPELEAYRIWNVRPEGEELLVSPDAVRTIEALNDLDLRLYEYASRSFELRMQQMREEMWERRDLRPRPMLTLRKVLTRDPSLQRLVDPTRIQLARFRRHVIPEGSRAEKVYTKIRKMMFGW